jgi:hypothetical protein
MPSIYDTATLRKLKLQTVEKRKGKAIPVTGLEGP